MSRERVPAVIKLSRTDLANLTETLRRGTAQQPILQAGDVPLHCVRQRLHSPDPQLREKVNAICAL